MTEVEWNDCKKIGMMYRWLRHRASDRKLRLFGCACCRRLWQLIPAPESRECVEVSERFADGLTGLDALRETRDRAKAVIEPARISYYRARYGSPREAQAAKAAWMVATAATKTPFGESALEISLALPKESRAQCELIREIFGNPFRPVTINPGWLSWSDNTVRRLAEAIYDERALDRLPILADALEEAGCADAALLDHCRGPGPHVRGCWVVDLLLGKS
ncbi:MAG TPA: hypothetical protein VJ739_07635 [Gemmataceae bacterium]|nr:hypothetical protein [Gemmataceae bacterium]